MKKREALVWKTPAIAFLLAISVLGCKEEQNDSSGILGPKNDAPVAPVIATPVPSANVNPKPTPSPSATPKSTPGPAIITVPKGVSGQPIVDNAKKYIGTVEKPGNRGAQIDAWNKAAGVPLGSPYCGSFAGAMHKASGFLPPSGYAYTPSWFGRNLLSLESSQPGDVLGFYFPDKGRIAHIGIIEKYGTPYTSLIEANTSYDARAGSASDREGDGVHRKLRNTKILSQGKNKTARYW